MGYYMSKIWTKIFGKEYFNILMIGLDGAGKNTILKKITNSTNVEHKRLNIKLYDLGGVCTNNCLYKQNFYNIDGLIFVIDSNDKQRISEASKYFEEINRKEELKSCPILIMANKQDYYCSLTQDEIIKIFNLKKYCNRKWCIKGISSLKEQGIEESILWMLSSLNE